MPIYDFKCNGLDCQNIEELLVKLGEVPNCSKCGRELEKQASSTAINTRGCSGASKPYSH